MQLKVQLLSLLFCFGAVPAAGRIISGVGAAAATGGLLEIKDVILEFIQRKPITMITIYYCNNGECRTFSERGGTPQ